MVLRSLIVVLILGVASAHLPGCSGLSELGEDAAAPPASEQAVIREQAEKALAEGRYNAAWNQEVAAGADRDRLEAVAVAALGARSRHAAGMFDALRARFGTLGPGGRSAVDQLVARARGEGSWSRALDLELTAADDPPAYKAAWAVYRAAPADVAPYLLEGIQEARADREESSD